MDIALIAVGKTATGYVREGIEEYLKRLKHYIPFTVETVPDVRSGKLSEEQQKRLEEERILSLLRPADRVVLLDENGSEYTSEKFAERLQKDMASGLKRLVFVIGGPYGFSPEVYGRADGKLSLSKMTLNHEMVRMFFVEQVYRAMTILRGEPYHHR